jgi:hypothetical protein
VKEPAVASLAAIVVLVAGCEGATTAPAPSSHPSTTAAAQPSATETTPMPTVALTPEPGAGGVPTSYLPDAPPSEVPPEALVPAGASVEGEWFAFTDDGVMIVVAWSEPGEDVSSLPRGFAVWRHDDLSPHWRAAFVDRSGRDGLSDIRITTADVTGDGSDDVLAFQADPFGGTGGCGTWLVVRLPQLDRIYRYELCDGTLQPGPLGAPGLVLTGSIYRPGDAHCCPSAVRTTTMVWDGSDWLVTDRTVTRA